MPATTWGHQPSVAPHGYGFTIPVAVTEIEVPAEGDQPGYTRWDGIAVEVRSLASVDITAGIDADPDAGPEHLTEALAAALDTTAPTVQTQLDEITDIILGGL